VPLDFRHAKVATTPDNPAAEIGSGEWNAQHVLTGTANRLLGFDGGGALAEVDPATVGGGGEGYVPSGLNPNDAADNTAAVMAAAAPGRRLYLPPAAAAYRFTDPAGLSLPALCTLSGSRRAPTINTPAGDAGTTMLNFVPSSGTAATFIKNAASANGCGVEDIGVKTNRATDVAIGINGSYGNFVRRVSFYGTMLMPVFMDNTYVCYIDDIVTVGAAVHRYCTFIGPNTNQMVISRPHFSNLPPNAAIAQAGIGIAGGSGHTILAPCLQGHTFGIILKTPQGVDVINPRSENVLCNIRTGSAGFVSNGISLRRGTYSRAYTDHPQYSSRGPLIYAEGAKDLDIDHPTFLNVRRNANGTIADADCFPIVVGNNMHTFMLRGGSWVGSRARDEIFRGVAAASPGYQIDAFWDHNDTRSFETIRKTPGNYGMIGYGTQLTAAGAINQVFWQPDHLEASGLNKPVSSLLNSAFFDPVLPA